MKVQGCVIPDSVREAVVQRMKRWVGFKVEDVCREFRNGLIDVPGGSNDIAKAAAAQTIQSERRKGNVERWDKTQVNKTLWRWIGAK